MARIQQQISRRPSRIGTYPFERIHFDIIILGTKGKKGYSGDTCIAHFWCDNTKYHRAWPLPNHKEISLFPIFESTIALAKKFGLGIKWIHSDDEQGIGGEIDDLTERDGIVWEISPPYTHEANGPAERSGRAIADRGRAILWWRNRKLGPPTTQKPNNFKINLVHHNTRKLTILCLYAKGKPMQYNLAAEYFKSRPQRKRRKGLNIDHFCM